MHTAWPHYELTHRIGTTSLFVAAEADGPGEPVFLKHVALMGDGREVDVDWCWTREMTRADFERWLRLGCPRRTGPRPLTSENLEEMET